MEIDDPIVLGRASKHLFKGRLSDRSTRASGDSPFCGDDLTVECRFISSERGIVLDAARFDGYACSLCTATADLLCDRLRGRSAEDIADLEVDDVLEMWGGMETGRMRRGCVELPIDLFAACSKEQMEGGLK